MRNKRERKKANEERSARFASEWREYNARMNKEEEEERKAQFEANKAYESYLLEQATDAKKQRDHEKEQDVSWARGYNQRLTAEEERFSKAAMARVEALEAMGKDPYPLRKCLLEFGKKKLLPARMNPEKSLKWRKK